MSPNATLTSNKTKLSIAMSLLSTTMPVGMTILASTILASTILTATILASSTVSADNPSVVDRIKITVPVACTISGTGMNSHNADINNGLYEDDIGSTILHAFCNDNEGFAIYAAGYTGNEIGATNSNKLVGTTASNNAVIASGLATTAGNPDVSNWAMKLAITQDSGDTAGTNAFTIDSAPNVDLPSQAEQSATQASFTQYHIVPNEYTKVAHKNSATDMTATTGGVKLTTTYAAYISKTQPADTYSGQVIYTLVHPSDHDAPVAHPAVLDTGRTVNAKLKSLAATVINGVETTITPEFDPDNEDWDLASDSYIKSIVVHLETPVPNGFTPTDANIISSSASNKPIYIVFDNTNDAGIMHFYTEGEQIFLPSDSSFMFYLLFELTTISDINDWDTSNATDMSYMFYNAGFSATTWSIGDLSSWDVSNVTNMSGMFFAAGSSATTWSIGDLSSWDVSNVTDMSSMFSDAGSPATTWSIGDLSSWDVSNVTNMNGMFSYAGSSATTWSIGYLSSWDVSNVTDMSYMFNNAGRSATTWSIGDLSSWDVSNVTNMRGMFSYAGYSASTFHLNLSSWNISNVTIMRDMFSSAGSSATTWSVGDLSSWDVSNVTDMSYMFSGAGSSASDFNLNLSSWNISNVTNMGAMFSFAGSSATTWSITIPATNGNGISNTTNRLYGQTTSIYATPPTGKSFTLAQP